MDQPLHNGRSAHRQGLRLVCADQLLISAAHSLGIDADLVA